MSIDRCRLPLSVCVLALLAIGALPTPAAAGPSVRLSNRSLGFSPQALTTSSAPQMVTLTNTGDAPLNIGGVVASAEFSTSGCIGGLAPGASCTMTVAFSPAVGGARTGTITISDNAVDSPQVINL